MRGPVAVTGATGFIGNAVLRSLAGQGESLRALTRRPAAAVTGVHWVQGNLDDRPALEELVEGARAIIHCAGRVRGASASDFDRANALGTSSLLEVVATRRPAPRVLLMSSLAARHPGLSWYASSKRRAEEIASLHGRSLPIAIFRPTAVYGPGDREIRPLFELMRRGVLPIVVPARRFTLLHVSDLVAAVQCWLAAPSGLAGIFELDDRTPGGYDWLHVRTAAEAAWGIRIRPIPLPAPLLSGLSHLNVWASRLTGHSPMLTPGKVRELTSVDWLCDNGDVHAVPDWQPQIRLSDALRDEALLTDARN